jgi:hypothetical protein
MLNQKCINELGEKPQLELTKGKPCNALIYTLEAAVIVGFNTVQLKTLPSLSQIKNCTLYDFVLIIEYFIESGLRS